MRSMKTILVGTILLASSAAAEETDISVVASIKPVHSLVAAVMDGVGTPALIIEGARSPHTYALKPSQARLLQSADVVFWVGGGLEAFLEKPLRTVATRSKTVALLDASGLSRLDFRDGAAFEAHDHPESAAHDHGDHGTAHNGGHGTHHDAHDRDHGAANAENNGGHAHLRVDPHIWLDPLNAKTLVQHITQTLAEADPVNADRYEANARALTSKLDRLTRDIAAELGSVRGKGFVVFHDAYQYFEVRFGLQASGAITMSPETPPGAERVAEIRERIQTSGVMCVFSEPQFEPKLVSTVLEGSNAASGVLDPLGSFLEHGPDLYFDLIRAMAESFKSCLGNVS